MYCNVKIRACSKKSLTPQAVSRRFLVHRLGFHPVKVNVVK